MTAATRTITFKLNGAPVTADVKPHHNLVELLQTQFGLTGARESCGQGMCGCCTVLVNGLAVSGCLYLASLVEDCEVRTVENEKELDTVQAAFIEAGAFQCGYCTPGFVNAATVLLERLKRRPVLRSEVEAAVAAALENHICRCTGYVRYYQAVRDVILATPGLTRDGA